MSGKRPATSDLNYSNWNQHDQSEKARYFTKITEEVPQNRAVIISKRRKTTGSADEKKGALVNFNDFTKPLLSAPSTSSSPLSFVFPSCLMNKSEEQPKRNGLSDAFATKTSAGASNTLCRKTKESDLPFFEKPVVSSKKSIVYYAKLKGLNEGVSNWIKKHVDENPFLDLTPVFKDYEKYLQEIETLESIHVRG